MNLHTWRAFVFWFPVFLTPFVMSKQSLTITQQLNLGEPKCFIKTEKVGNKIRKFKQCEELEGRIVEVPQGSKWNGNHSGLVGNLIPGTQKPKCVIHVEKIGGKTKRVKKCEEIESGVIELPQGVGVDSESVIKLLNRLKDNFSYIKNNYGIDFEKTDSIDVQLENLQQLFMRIQSKSCDNRCKKIMEVFETHGHFLFDSGDGKIKEVNETTDKNKIKIRIQNIIKQMKELRSEKCLKETI